MAEFQRSSSKVWWLEDSISWRRRASASPGSQDSGFSDAESSPPLQQQQPQPQQENNDEAKLERTPEQIKNDITKNGTTDKTLNLSSNIKEKSTPRKNLILQNDNKNSIDNNTPVTTKDKENQIKKPNRNLFTNIQIQDSEEYDQYAEDVIASVVDAQRLNKTNTEVTYENSHSWLLNENSKLPECVKSLQNISNDREYQDDEKNLTAPPNLLKQEDSASVNISDCDSEIESLFIENIQSPEHTSTPKTIHKRKDKNDLQKKFAMNLLLKYQNER